MVVSRTIIIEYLGKWATTTTTHTVKKSKETKIAKHPPRFLIYGAKMLDKGVAASKKILALCLF